MRVSIVVCRSPIDVELTPARTVRRYVFGSIKVKA